MEIAVKENSEFLDKYKDGCVGRSMSLATVLKNIQNSIYNINSFKKEFLNNENIYMISLRDLHSKILSSDEVLKTGPNKVHSIFKRMKKEYPYLGFINNIGLFKNDKPLVPRYFIDRIINTFIMFAYSSSN